MSIKLDLEGAKKAVAERIASRLPPARDRALNVLRDVLDAELSVSDFVSYVHALCDKHSYVSESVGAIKVSEILNGADKPKTRSPTRNRARSRDTEAAVSALESFLASSKDYLPRSEIFKAVLAATPTLTEAQVLTAWNITRPSLSTQGRGPMVKFKKS
jgi:hypothetical protein